MPYFGVPIRNGLPIGLGSQAGFGIAPFDPRDLFSAGEQGAWYDPSDYSTLFTDSAGTTPVTGVEQFVGLMLDKSKGLVLGSELVTNGDFSNGTTGWTGTLTLAVVNGELQMTRTASGQDVSQIITTVAGQSYKISVSYRNGTTSSAIYIGSTAGGSNLLAVTTLSSAATQTFTAYFTATNATSYIQFGLNALGGTAFIDNVTVKSIAGNHATSTGTKRPKLAARYNLLTYTEQFDNAAWTKFNSTVTQNAAVAPNGTVTAEKLIPNNGATVGFIFSPNASPVVGAQYVASVYVKAAELGFAFVVCNVRTTSSTGVCINLATGALTNQSANGTYTVVDAGNGWWQVTATVTATSVNGYLEVWPLAAAGVNGSYTGDGTSGVLIWGADLRPASQATGLIGPTYQRVVDAATYDTVGFLPYLSFDGIDDSMSTGSIDFTATDKMTVWAGVRKQAAGLGMIAELSASVSANNGTFYFAANNGTNDYGVSLKGTAQATYQPATYTNPITNVISAAFDIGVAAIADENKPRVNGVLEQDNPTGADAGTGNFGNYALFIGARNNASLYFNGWLSSLIVRGAQSTQSQIEATESWVNGRTGAF